MQILRKTMTILTASILVCTKAQACGLALALTVDVSGSVDGREYRLQIDGLAAALRDEAVAKALLKENASLTLIQWSGTQRQVVSVPWRKIDQASDIEAMAEDVERARRAWHKYSTGIGEALVFAANHFIAVSDCKRKVIDVSGDGYSNEGIAPEDIKTALVKSGFVINGLAIEGSAEALTAYYQKFVVAGNGAFVMTANNYDEYPKRILQKLLREVSRKVALADE